MVYLVLQDPHHLLARLPLHVLLQGRPQPVRQGLHGASSQGGLHHRQGDQQQHQQPHPQDPGREDQEGAQPGLQPRAGTFAPSKTIDAAEELFPHLMKSKEIKREEVEGILREIATNRIAE